jgi:tryptophanyl-tRNA synthetase
MYDAKNPIFLLLFTHAVKTACNMFGKTSKKVLLSGVKPTGRPHIGNYFGAMKQFVDLLNSGQYECYFFIADYHALNLVQNAEKMRQNIYDLALDYLAIGLDPKKATLFKQSDVPAHIELSCIFDTIVTMPYLMRAHAYKDAEAKSKEINVGTFNYPVLMAADILLYNTDVVPVGADQKQHVEYARDIAEKFNFTFCGTTKDGVNADKAVFKIPEPLIIENVATVLGTDGRKMSKSYDNTIPLFATREEITKAVMGIVTDSNTEGVPTNVYAIHKLFKSEAELKLLYEANKGKYKALKEALIEDIDSLVKPMRERRAELAKDSKLVAKVLADGAKKANKVAQEKLEQAKQAVGVI